MNNILVGFRGINLYYNYPEIEQLLLRLSIGHNRYDRFGFLKNDYSDLIKYSNYSLTKETNKSFEDVFNDCIIPLKKYDKIYVLFSGGIDSCTILAQLANFNLLNKTILVIYNETLENRQLISNFIHKNNISVIYFDDEHFSTSRNQVILNAGIENACLIMTCGSDYLTESIFDFCDDINPLALWKDESSLSKEFVEIIENWISNFPFANKINTVHDLGWLLNVALDSTYYKYLSNFQISAISPNDQYLLWSSSDVFSRMITDIDEILNCTPWINSEYKKNHKTIIRTIFNHALDNYPKVHSHKLTQNKFTWLLDNVATDGIKTYSKIELNTLMY